MVALEFFPVCPPARRRSAAFRAGYDIVLFRPVDLCVMRSASWFRHDVLANELRNASSLIVPRLVMVGCALAHRTDDGTLSTGWCGETGCRVASETKVVCAAGQTASAKSSKLISNLAVQCEHVPLCLCAFAELIPG
jgi:hypothetical protein